MAPGLLLAVSAADVVASPATEGPATVGPLGVVEHVAWFLLLSLFVFLIYNGLRTESVTVAVKRGVRRWVSFVLATIILGAISGLLAEFL